VNATIDGLLQTVVLNKLSIADLLVNQQQQSLQLSLAASINQAPLTFDTRIDLNNKTGDVSSNISLTDFSLDSISPMLAKQAIELSG
jgi:hypothetical protein